jgi:hypothetical protein
MPKRNTAYLKELSEIQMASIWGRGSGGGKSTTPAADPAIGAAETQMANLDSQEWNTYKNTVMPQEEQEAAAQEAQTQQVDSADIANMNANTKLANSQYAQYNNVYVPMQDQMATEAANYNTQGNFEQQAQLAEGDTQSAFDSAKQQQAMTQESYGGNPTSGAAMGAESAMNTQEAAAKASAATRARQAALQMGWSMEGQAIGQGNTDLSQGLTASGTSTNQGTAANASSTTGLAGTESVGSSNTSANSAALAGESAIGSLGEQTYSTGVNAWNDEQQANNQSSAGIGSALGGLFAGSSIGTGANGTGASGLGLLATISDKRVKEDIKKVGKTDDGLPIYTYRYKGDPAVRMGVMAQEAEKKQPAAALTLPSGLKAVDYSKVH